MDTEEDKHYLFAHWHPTAQASSQANDFSDESFEGQILLQDYTSKDGFQLRDTRALKKQIRDAEKEKTWGWKLTKGGKSHSL